MSIHIFQLYTRAAFIKPLDFSKAKMAFGSAFQGNS